MFAFFKSKVKASMTKYKLYRTRVSLRKETAGVRSGYCNCKAGATGRCKHVGALLFTILDFVESELNQIPPDTTCTELLAASIDGEVSNPTARLGAIGNLEMKYIQFPSKIPQPDGRKDLQHIIAENKKNSCLEITNTGLRLKTRHHYYAQIKGGMGISGRQWCDLAVYTYCGNIEDLH